MQYLTIEPRTGFTGLSTQCRVDSAQVQAVRIWQPGAMSPVVNGRPVSLTWPPERLGRGKRVVDSVMFASAGDNMAGTELSPALQAVRGGRRQREWQNRKHQKIERVKRETHARKRRLCQPAGGYQCAKTKQESDEDECSSADRRQTADREVGKRCSAEMRSNLQHRITAKLTWCLKVPGQES